MLENVFWGNTLESWGISILIVLGTVLFMKLASLIIRKGFKRLAAKTKNQLDDILFESLEAPVLFGIVFLGVWIALHRLDFSLKVDDALRKAYSILVVLNVTWFFVRLMGSLVEFYWGYSPEKKGKSDKHRAKMLPIIKRSLLVLIWIIGGVTALASVNVNVGALLGTLGIGGIAFALASQDTIKNIFGAFTLLTDKPFTIGDIVKIDAFEGTIVDVGIRSTKMRNYDQRLVTFPNSKISDANIVNISAEPMRRVVMKLGLTYDTTPEKMTEALTLLRDMPNRVKFVSPKGLKAHFTEFGDSAMVITFVYFIEKKGNISDTISDANLEILNSFNSAGLGFAFPSQTVYLEKN